MKRLFFAVLTILLSFNSVAQEKQSSLLEGSSYRLEKTITLEPVTPDFEKQGCKLSSKSPAFAGRASKFKVIKKKDGCDVIRFWSVFKNSSTDDSNLALEDIEYVLPNSINGIPVDASTTRTGKISGLLVVPYKFRNDDGAITGEATVGYYAGWETSIGTYLLSAGLSQVSLPVSDTETENQSAITIAAGLLLKNWDNVDIGVIVGLDHIGGKKGDNWQYEDDPWLSIMIGWNFSQ